MVFAILGTAISAIVVGGGKNKEIIENSKRNLNENIFPHFWSDKGFKGAVVKQVLPSFPGGSLQIMLTVPFRRKSIFNHISNWQYSTVVQSTRIDEILIIFQS